MSMPKGSHFSSGALEKIAQTVGTPAYVYSKTGLLGSFRELEKGLSKLDHQICFAAKSNSNIAILKLLVEEGAGLDVVSGGELYRAAKAGARGDRIVFSGVGKTPEEMADALSKRIFSFNVESAE